MNFVENYLQAPRNYVIVAPEGYGKSTILKYMYCSLLERKIGGETVLPIYIRMADVNLKSEEEIRQGLMLGYLNEHYYRNALAANGYLALREMIRKCGGQYRFLFLLDGMNEVHNRMFSESGGNVYDYITNEFTRQDADGIRLMDYPNLDIVITTRNEAVIQRQLYEKVLETEGMRGFCLVKLIGLTSERKKAYLDIPSDGALDAEVDELVSTPMLAKMYKEIKERDGGSNAFVFESKYKLLDVFYDLDVYQNQNTSQIDHWDATKKMVLSYVLPLIALGVENALLDAINNDEALKENIFTKGLGHAVGEVLDLFDDMPLHPREALRAIRMLDIVNEKLEFKHDMIREYWCSKGVNLCLGRKVEKDSIRRFFVNLNKNTYRAGTYDPVRQTRHLGMVETLYSSWEADAEGFDSVVKQMGFAFEDEKGAAQNQFFTFMHHYASILDDENERKNAALLVWPTYDYFKKCLGGYYDSFEKARILNSLAYSGNNYKIEGRDPLPLFEEAKEILDGMPEQEKEKASFRVLYGKILNNFGSYYYGPYQRDYTLSAYWHKKCKEYREMYGVDLTASYRAIASDYYMMAVKMYQASYETFKEYIAYLTAGKKSKLSEMTEDEKTKMKDIVVVINALGTECGLLFAQPGAALQAEIIEEIVYQLRFCYQCMERGSRREAVDVLNKLRDKIGRLTAWYRGQQVKYPEIEKALEEYGELRNGSRQ